VKEGVVHREKNWQVRADIDGKRVVAEWGFGRGGRWREDYKLVGSVTTSSLRHSGPYGMHHSVVGERALRGQGRSQAGEKPAVLQESL